MDTSLLAALVAEVESSAHIPPPDQVATLRATLQELAKDATEQYERELCDELNSAHISSQYHTTDDWCSFTDYYAETTESSTSDSSVLSNQSFTSPLGFLQAALPHIPPSKLRRALNDADSGDGIEVDMEFVVENLLTNEYLRELEERGLDGLDDEEAHDPGEEGIWHLVGTKKKAQLPSPSKKSPKKKNARGKTITVVDIRQRQHMPIQTAEPFSQSQPDMWSQISSLSEHLATLLPPHQPSFFQPYFHSPNYSSPAQAVRAALSDILERNKSPQSPKSPRTSESALFTLLDVIRGFPAYATLTPERRSTVFSDAQLALTATQECGDRAIDIVQLLLELELDLQTGSLEMGAYHIPQSAVSPTSTSSLLSSPTSPTAKSPVRTTNGAGLPSPRDSPPSPQSPTKRKPNSLTASQNTGTLEWQIVAPRKPPPNNGPHPLSLSIPAYNGRRGTGNAKVRGAGNGLGKGGKGDVGELIATRRDMRRHMTESWKKQSELLCEASKAWRAGNAKSRGGEVAQYLAERVSLPSRKRWCSVDMLMRGLLSCLGA